MTRELLILRHGKAKELEDDGSDEARPLKTRGKRQAQKIGAWLQQRDLLPDLVISSPAERTLVSAQKALKAGGQAASGIQLDKRLYLAPLEVILTVLSEHGRRPDRVMIVGHNPGLEDLVLFLVGPSLSATENRGVMGTGTLYHLSMPADWTALASGCARVASCVLPDTLPTGFPFPGPDGPEIRDRPAYYYTQASVIPYRERNGNLEILIITSSKKIHWRVPKGIRDPGLTAQASAAREAEEEAGILGRVNEKLLGTYSYDKWGAPCTVEVYAMEVTVVIDDMDWDEDYRDRRWVTPDQAIAHLEHDALKAILADFAARFTRDFA